MPDDGEGNKEKTHTSLDFMIARGKKKKNALTCVVGSIHFPGQAKCRSHGSQKCWF